VAGDERRAGVAALQRLFQGVEPKPALQLGSGGAVAGVAAVDQDGPDVLFEELGGGGILLSGVGGCREGEQEDQG